MAVTKRNYGIDLLRIVSMLMVVILHVLSHGGILDALNGGVSVKYSAVWFLEAASDCAVNCYALISGYVGINSNPSKKYRNIFKLYLNVIFYTVLISAGFRLLVPDSTSWTYVLQSFLPFWFNMYWYYTAYFCLSFFTSYINSLINILDKKKMVTLIVTIMIFFSFIPIIFQKDFYLLKNGYSLLWLTLLYVVGGCLRRLRVATMFKKWQLGLFYVVPVIIAWVVDVILKANNVKGIESGFLIHYISPCILISSIALVLLFAKLDIKKSFIRKTISLFAASSFSVYLIHEHPLIRKYLLMGSTKFIANFPVVGMIGAILGVSVAIYLVCSGIDFVRVRISRAIGGQIKKRLFSERF